MPDTIFKVNIVVYNIHIDTILILISLLDNDVYTHIYIDIDFEE